MVTYSIIIPHKNSKKLLQRCLASIPEREDVQIIIVDDNSRPEEKPQANRKNVRIIHLDERHSNGAGHARNVGMEEAQGEWILFADADDTYSEGFLDILDEYKKCDVHVIYFNYNYVKGNDISHNVRPYTDTSNRKKQFQLKYLCKEPWSKMVKREFIKRYKIVFEECPVGNDIFYSYQVGYWSNDKIEVVNKPLYNYHTIVSSITHTKKGNTNYYLTIFKHIYQVNAFYRFLDYPEFQRTIFNKFMAILLKKGYSQFLLALKTYITFYSEIRKDEMTFVNHFKQKVL